MTDDRIDLFTLPEGKNRWFKYRHKHLVPSTDRTTCIHCGTEPVTRVVDFDGRVEGDEGYDPERARENPTCECRITRYNVTGYRVYPKSFIPVPHPDRVWPGYYTVALQVEREGGCYLAERELKKPEDERNQYVIDHLDPDSPKHTADCYFRNEYSDPDADPNVGAYLVDDETGEVATILSADYRGKVFADRERNYYDDSDFYAIVLEDGRLTTVEFGTTRAAAPTAVDRRAFALEGSEAYQEARMIVADSTFQTTLDRFAAEARQIEVGKTVRVNKPNSRKNPKEGEGRVFWTGERPPFGYRYSKHMEHIVGVEIDGQRWFYKEHECEVVDPEEWLEPDAVEQAYRYAAASYAHPSWVSHVYYGASYAHGCVIVPDSARYILMAAA